VTSPERNARALVLPFAGISAIALAASLLRTTDTE
jgi:hypothetical protein